METHFRGALRGHQAKNVLERGGSNAQALWSGVPRSGGDLFENFSVDQLLSEDRQNWKSLLAETAKQAGVEASEEMFTEVANILSEAAIMWTARLLHRRGRIHARARAK
jgi:hypothetical protein